MSFLSKANDAVFFTIASPSSHPFIYQDKVGELQGVLVELFKQLELESDIKVQIHLIPWARALEEVKNSRYDALMPTMYTKERAGYLVYPKDELINFFDNVMLKRVEDKFKFTAIENIPDDKVIAKVRSVSLGAEFDRKLSKRNLKIIEVLDTKTAILMLNQGKVDIVFSDYFLALSIIKQENIETNIAIQQLSNKAMPSYLAFSKRFAKHQNVNSVMNEIKRVLQSKKYKKVYAQLVPDFIQAKNKIKTESDSIAQSK